MRILYVDMHLGIWPHARLGLQLIETLAEMGHEVDYVSCSKTQEYRCAVNESYNRPTSMMRDGRDCAKCRVSQVEFGRQFSADSRVREVQMDQLVDSIASKLRLERILLAESQAAEREYVSALGCPITQLASYEMFLKYKLAHSGDLSDEHRKYRASFEQNSLRMSLAGHALANSEAYDAVVAYSPQYSSQHSFLWEFSNKGIPVYFAEGSSALNERYSHLRLWDWNSFGLVNPKLSSFRKQQVPKEVFPRISAHFDVIRRGTSFSVYSPRDKNIDSRRAYAIPDSASYAVLAMSSSDELLAARVIDKIPKNFRRMRVFESQVHWLTETISWYRDRPEFFLVVRPHPRDFPTRREPVTSGHSNEIAKVLEDLPFNVKVDGPNDPLPLWSHFGSACGLVTGWSSTALEALHHDLPVITFDSSSTSFPAEMTFSGDSKESYFLNLENLMKGRLFVNEEQRETFLSWMHQGYFESTIPMTGLTLQRLRLRSRFADRLLNFLDLTLSPIVRRLDVLNLNRKRNRQTLRRADALSTLFPANAKGNP